MTTQKAVFHALMMTVSVIMLTHTAYSDVLKAGYGSYLTTPPKPCKPLPERIYKTADFKESMITGQW
jgi:hypothetical protein